MSQARNLQDWPVWILGEAQDQQLYMELKGNEESKKIQNWQTFLVIFIEKS
jgi:hypothetical protein